MDSHSRNPSADVFVACAKARDASVLIRKVSKSDKEFHFQNWVEARIDDASLSHDSAGRNSYPDFTLVHHPEGYEVKGLAFPGREASYDANSRLPSGMHNGRTVFYVFGRYPADFGEPEYPVLDLVICHGDFLNANHRYEHKTSAFVDLAPTATFSSAIERCTWHRRHLLSPAERLEGRL